MRSAAGHIMRGLCTRELRELPVRPEPSLPDGLHMRSVVGDWRHAVVGACSRAVWRRQCCSVPGRGAAVRTRELCDDCLLGHCDFWLLLLERSIRAGALGRACSTAFALARALARACSSAAVRARRRVRFFAMSERWDVRRLVCCGDHRCRKLCLPLRSGLVRRQL